MSDDKQQAEGLVEIFLGQRLSGAQEPPGVRDAVAHKLALQLQNVKERCGEQIGQLRSPSSKRIPDAYFHDEEALENALQEAGAGIRTARASGGLIGPDARAQEARFAPALAPSARWAALAEASRVPRPTTRHEALGSTLTPIPWQEDETEWPPSAAIDLTDQRQVSDAEPVRVTERPFVDWIQLGLFEHQRTLPTRYPDAPGRQLVITTGIEVLDGPPQPNTFPLGIQPPGPWLARYDKLDSSLTDEAIAKIPDVLQGPMAALADFDGLMGAPGRHRGAGLHPFILTPHIAIAAYLGLRPERPASRTHLVDDEGPAVVGRLWRGFLIHGGDYTPLEPAIHGSDLIVRPDLYDRLVGAFGSGRLHMGVAVNHHEGSEHDLDD